MKIVKIFAVVFLFIQSVEAKKILPPQFSTETLDTLIQNAKKYLEMSPVVALEYAEKVIALSPKDADSPLIADAYGILGEVYYFQEDYRKALKNYTKELEIRRKFADKKTLMIAIFNIGILQKELKNNRKAIENYEKSLALAQEIDNNEVIIKCYEALSDSYQKLGSYKRAYNYHKLYVSQKDAVTAKEISVIKIRYAKIKKQKDKELKKREIALKQAIEKEKELIEDVQQKGEEIEELHVETEEQKQEIKVKEEVIEQKEQKVEELSKTILIAIIGFLVILLYSILLFRQYKQKKKANMLLALQNEEIQQQKEEIEAQRDELEVQRDRIVIQNKNITDSISYASRIQNAILPHTDILEQTVSEYFILFKPRNIVSGDFYWFSKVGNKLVIAAADCTGHGVPGAFMSMLGTAFLDEIVNKTSITEPNLILNKLRGSIIKALKQDNESMKSKDGMDIALLSIDLKARNFSFSGANNPVYYIKKGELLEIKGDRMPIGIYARMEPYAKHKATFRKGDSIYIFSDGYIDQFGGPEEKKLKKEAFKKLLLDIHQVTMAEQEVQLEEFMRKWQGSNEQVDDILIIGLKI